METTIKIKNLPEGYQSIISNGKHSIVGDEPLTSKGTDLGFSPVDLLLAGLGMCKVATIRTMARSKKWEIHDIQAEVHQEVKREKTGFKTTVKVNISIEGDVTEDQKEMLLKQADNCYVHRMLEGQWDIQSPESLNV